MTPFDFEQLRPGKEDCPSDVTLWRLHAGELTGEALEQTRRHVDGCRECAERMAQREAGFDAWPEADPRRMLAAIRRQAGERPSRLATRWSRTLRFVLAPLALAGAAAVFLLARPRAVDVERAPAVTRSKGGPILHVFRQTEGAGREVLSGDRFRSGDRLQFAVDLESESRVEIIGIEASGRLYPVWPLTEGAVRLPAGQRQSIPTAVELDEAPGSETLYLVACPPEEAQPACTSRGASAAPTCKPGCVTTPFVLHKGR